MSLSATLSTATQSLQAQELELQITNNNIANASTTGYTREIVNLSESDPSQVGQISVGNGVTINGITSVRDELLTNQIQQQTSQQSSSDAQVNALSQLQTLFPSTGSSVATDLSAFFTSLSGLSTAPTDAASRQTAISSAQTLVSEFNSLASGLSGPASDLNTTVTNDVTQINQLSTEAASLNQQLVAQQATGQNTGTIGDQLNQVESQLASLTNIAVVHTSDGDSITTGNGSPLVLGNQSYALTTSTGAGGALQIIDANANNITTAISSGDLGGTIQVRDTQIPALSNSLDTLVNQFATAFNAAQAKGFDQNGNAGTALFNIPTTVAGSAAGITLATTSASAIAASSDGSSGSNGNLTNLTALQNSSLPAGSSVTTLTANLTFQIGSLTSNATAQSNALKLSLSALNDQQSSVSGVSIDEESANLLRFQQSYEAAAKIISTIQSLFETTIDMIH